MNVDEITSGRMTTASDFVDLEDSFNHDLTQPPAPWAFRGQPRTFGTLVPSFQRIFTGKKSQGTAEIIERNLVGAFRTHYADLQGRTLDMPAPEQIGTGYEPQCLSVMQHYGVPTRLLDWTGDFWTATYFACAGDPGQDAELWFYDRSMFWAPPPPPSVDSLSPAAAIWFAPMLPHLSLSGPGPLPRIKERLIGELVPQMTPRMVKQFAHHTVSNDVFADHASLIADVATAAAKTPLGFRRVVIAGSCKEKVLQFLEDEKKVTAGTVFPDVEGLGRFLRWHLDSLVTRLL